MKDIVLSVYQLNDYVKLMLERDPLLRQVKVKGEISNFKLHSSGHMYFSLKDDKARVQCVFFRQNNLNLNFMPKDGMKVIALGSTSVFLRDGQYQLYVQDLLADGLGELYLTYEALKAKLNKEGLFAPEHKKSLPLLPRKIAVITSHTGAAVRDIINVIKRRNARVDILVIPVQVQGLQAHKQIASAIRYANTRDDIDLIITGRGGGSIEELWAFNEEELARAIFESKLPIISAVGHETDYTIVDFVADVRAPTPSAAAELAVPEASRLIDETLRLKKDLLSNMTNLFTSKIQLLQGLSSHLSQSTAQSIINQKNQEYDLSLQRLNSASRAYLQDRGEILGNLTAALQALSPLAVIARGYTYILDESKERSIHSIESLKEKSKINICFKDGSALALVEKLNKEFEIQDGGDKYEWKDK